ncbi:MAG TPA: GNAT family N-acetyltransferase [Oceanospirillaceae bacterium]|nr:GNAT family N-acetyltransferase [Oceanospirillaceae bacterium]
MSLVRPATVEDLASINHIYNYYVASTHITFDEEAWSAQQRTAWFEKLRDSPYDLLVCEHDKVVVGFAYSSAFRPKTAYNRSAEVTIYTDQKLAPKGAGTQLYQVLIERAEHKFHRLYAVIALPNTASLGLHEKLGFQKVGQMNDVGYKFGAYHSVALLEKRLQSTEYCPL